MGGKHITREDDLKIIQMILDGWMMEVVPEKTGIRSPSHRLARLSLKASKIRKLKKEGMTAEQILDATPFYMAKEAKVEAKASPVAQSDDDAVRAIFLKLDQALRILAKVERFVDERNIKEASSTLARTDFYQRRL